MSDAIPDSAWLDQKLATLSGVYDYSYNVGTGYELIPKSVYQNGFPEASRDRSQDAVPFGESNYPFDPQNLYAGHADVGSSDFSQYHVQSEEQRLIDWAPVDPNFPYPVVQRLRSMLKGNSVLPVAHSTNNDDIQVVQGVTRFPDPGLTAAPQSGPFAQKDPAQGKFSHDWAGPLISGSGTGLSTAQIAIIAAATYYVVTRSGVGRG